MGWGHEEILLLRMLITLWNGGSKCQFFKDELFPKLMIQNNVFLEKLSPGLNSHELINSQGMVRKAVKAKEPKDVIMTPKDAVGLMLQWLILSDMHRHMCELYVDTWWYVVNLVAMHGHARPLQGFLQLSFDWLGQSNGWFGDLGLELS